MIKQRSGFTLLETALVVAIATLLFMAVVVGFGGRIATSRYDTAATEVADYLRDVYTETLNTENYRSGIDGARNYCTLSSASSGDEKLYIGSYDDYLSALENGDDVAFYPGRTNCAIYGKIAFFGVKGDSADQPEIHVFDIVGDVATAARQIKSGVSDTTTDLEQLKYKTILEELNHVHADFRASLPRNPESTVSTCQVAPAAGYTTYNFDWGTSATTANYSRGDYLTGRERNNKFVGFIMIVRSPLSGDVSTLFYERPSASEDNEWVFNLGDPESCETISSSSYDSPVDLLIEAQDDEDISDAMRYKGFCLSSNDLYVSAFGRRKFVQFIENGQNASAIKLNETDIKNPEEEGFNPCI